MSSSKGRRSSRTEARAAALAPAPQAAAPRWPEIVIGILDGFDAEGRPLVDYPGNEAGAPLAALTTALYGADAVGQAREERSLARRVLPQAGGDHIAHDDLLDVGGDEARAVHRLRDGGAPELDRLDVPEGAPILAHGSAAGARDHDVGQG